MKTTRLIVLLVAAVLVLQGCCWIPHHRGRGHHYSGYYGAPHGSVELRIPHMSVIIR